MQGVQVAGNHWVSGNTSLILPRDSFWPGIGNYTQWHIEKTNVFESLSYFQSSSKKREIGLGKKWGYMWSKPKKISKPYSCYIGEECVISCDWSSAGYRVKYAKKSHRETSSTKLRETGTRVEARASSVMFAFTFYGPAEYHLEYQQEYWSSPLERKWYLFEEQRYLEYPVYDHGIPVGLITYKKGPKFELDSQI